MLDVAPPIVTSAVSSAPARNRVPGLTKRLPATDTPNAPSPLEYDPLTKIPPNEDSVDVSTSTTSSSPSSPFSTTRVHVAVAVVAS